MTTSSRQMVPSKLFVAAKAFILHQGRVLIVREAETNPDGTITDGLFNLPGGRLTPGETIETCLQREIREETGLQVRIGRPFSTGEWRPVVRGEQWQIVAIFFECSTETDTVVLSAEHDAYEWIDPYEYSAYRIIDNIRDVFASYLALRAEGMSVP